ncbi:MAG: glycosyltransferase family 4 protein [Planctomycetota bacterium]
MKIALLTTPPSHHSGIADYSRHLLPYLMERADVQPYAPDALLDPEGEELLGREVRPVSALEGGDHDRLLYQLGNETAHAYMPALIAKHGGVVVQHDWVLFDLALSAWPGLARGGVKGAALAAREGDLSQLRRYLAAFAARRRAYRQPLAPIDPAAHLGPLIAGWHAAEDHGRWIADYAAFRLPQAATKIRLACNAPVGRTLTLRRGARALDSHKTHAGQPWEVFELDIDPGDEPFTLSVSPVTVTAEQRRHGDARRLGAFVESIHWWDAEGEHELDLAQAPELPIRPRSLSDARFELPFNSSIVGQAEGFIVHSEYLAGRIRAARGQEVPLAIVPHGAERRWTEEPRADVRRDAGLPESWGDAFLVTSFGGVQAHKRIDKALAALARARRERPDIRMVLAGKVSAEGFDARDVAQRLGLSDAVHFTGFVSEQLAWRLLHAGDLSLNLRGPTSGGTSGGIFQAFGLGRPVIASDAAEQSELPDQCTVKVPLGEGEVDAVAKALVDLRDDPQRLAALSQGARDYVNSTCHWSHCADGYVALLERAPARTSGLATAGR